MLDNTDHQQLHERIAAVAPLIPTLGAEIAAASADNADMSACPPFGKSKLDRILERAYDRIAADAGASVDPHLRDLLADTLPHVESPPDYSEGKLQRILARVQARLDADTTPVAPVASAKKPIRAVAALAGLRSAASALLLLRHLSFETRGPRPLTDGPAD